MFRMSLKNVGSPGGEVHGMSERHACRVVDHHWPINSLSTILRNALSRTSFPSQQKCQPRLRFLFLFSLSEKGRWKLRKSAASEVAFFGANRPRRELHEWKTPSTREDSRNQAKAKRHLAPKKPLTMREIGSPIRLATRQVRPGLPGQPLPARDG
jgi:hypothetical protein